jgi:SAM-dependent methyltransferase
LIHQGYQVSDNALGRKIFLNWNHFRPGKAMKNFLKKTLNLDPQLNKEETAVPPQVKKFSTDYRFTDRETKAYYVWLKYQSILKACKILDVGADECHLTKHLPSTSQYWGIGLGGSPDQQVNLEKEVIPFPDRSFDCVLCLDVLEHLDNIHAVFDEICRVSSRYVIISLPNPWEGFLAMLQAADYKPGIPIKFYGLPLEKPEDRHKWFFSIQEAENFIRYRAALNGMAVLEMDIMGENAEKEDWTGMTRPQYIREGIPPKNILGQSIWAVLERIHDGHEPQD